MNTLLVLFAGNLSGEAASPTAAPMAAPLAALIDGKNSLILALQQAQRFPGVGKTVLLTGPQGWNPPVTEEICIEKRDSWTVKALLETIAAHSEGFDLSYFAWADCPFLDPELAGRLAERHLRYAAEYSYADGWPYGLAPELLSPGTAAILAKILGDNDGGPVGRDALFSVIQKDINAFDIETEISPVDLRCHRLNLCADSKRNLLLLRRMADCTAGKIPDTAAVERIIAEKPEILRTLPAFYPVQVYGGCPQSCAWCPWPQTAGGPVTERRDYMDARDFESLLEKISAFSGDAVIDLSLWGELSLHPQKMELIEMVLRRPELTLVIETSGIGWKNSELEYSAQLARQSVSVRRQSPLSWIVSLDTADPAQYKEIRGAGFAEANDCAKTLLSLFPRDAYIQAVRTAGAENDIERFYRSWKEAAPATANIIIQKYDDFCGMLPRRQASDLSPIIRQPCWHLMRDMPILLDGTVPLCRQQIAAADNKCTLGNALAEPFELIWERGQRFYAEQSGAMPQYNSLCTGCDEYYTYNF
ncbi:MAG: spiro-SPASM protein [Treponema sp.]|jgi:spiro-SPASM protein|nr:spiro-SPASM protein [Treponema sp.]